MKYEESGNLAVLMLRGIVLLNKIAQAYIADGIGQSSINDMRLDMQVMLDVLSTIKPTLPKALPLEDI